MTATIRLPVSSPRDAGKVYVACNAQFGTQLGGRPFPLDNDAMMQACLSAPGSFGNFIGTLDGNGSATATIVMPNRPSLSGFELVTGYTVIDPTFPTGFLAMAKALFFQAF